MQNNNNCKFKGYVFNDPTPTTLTNGTKVVLTLTVSRPKKENEEKPLKDFVRATAFGKIADKIMQNISKNDYIHIETHFVSGSYEKDGKKIYTQDFIIDDISKGV